MFDDAQINTVAEWLASNRLPNRRSDDDYFERQQVAQYVKDAFRQEVGPYLRTSAPDERPLYVRSSDSWKTGIRGVKVRMKLLVVTDRRAWVLEHGEGVFEQPRTYDFNQIRITKKRVSFGGVKEEGGILEIVSGGDNADELAQVVATEGRSGPTSSLQKIFGVPATATAASAAGSGAWHPDPTGRHQMRWWDGERWTPSVADNGVQGDDPLPG